MIEALRLAREGAPPVAISYRTAPSAKMSVRCIGFLPSSCSGAMYWNVPTIVPFRRQRIECVAVGERGRLARPRDSSTLRQPEVEQLGAGLGEHDVAGLEVAVDDAVPVRAVERVGDLHAVPQHLLDGQRAAARGAPRASRLRGTP